MIFTDEDLKKIASNIKAIRLAYGYRSALDFALALNKNGNYPGLSHDMIKKYESGHYPITEQTVRLIASLTMCSFDEIVFGDLSDLEPDSLNFNGINKEDITNDELVEDFTNTVNGIFPLFTSKEAMKSEDFVKAYSICETIISKPRFSEPPLIEAVNTFLKTGIPEAYLNAMSIIGRLYVAYISSGMRQEDFEKISNKEYSNLFEFSKQMHKAKGYGEAAMNEIKRKFLDAYNGVLTTCMFHANEVDKYKDYVTYYLAIRYYYGIMDNEITKLTDNEMNSFGISMLDCLEKIGNKYAIRFRELVSE